jgi:hypothetical protein
MDCRDVQGRLAEFLEETTSAEEKKGIEEHLAACPSCRAAFEDLKRAVALVRDLDEVEPPPYLAQKIMAHVREEAEEGARSGVLRRLFFPLHVKLPIEALAVFLIAAFTFQVYRTIESDTKLAARLEKAPRATVEVAPKPEAVAPAEKVVAAPAPGKKDAPHVLRDTAPVVPQVGAVPSDTQQAPRQEEKAPRDDRPVPPLPTDERLSARKAEPLRESYDASLPAEPRLRGGAGAPPAALSAPAPTAPFPAAPAPPPSATRKAKEYKASATAPMPAEQKAEGAGADRQLKSVAPAPSGALLITLRTPDVNRALGETERLLNVLGALNIRKTSREDAALITADLRFDRSQGLSEKLGTLGETSTRLVRPDAPDSTITVRIEIIRKSE